MAERLPSRLDSADSAGAHWQRRCCLPGLHDSTLKIMGLDGLPRIYPALDAALAGETPAGA
jgi:hypothetical protein